MAWTYLLECADGSLYAGSTVDLDRRVAQHDLGLASAYTRPPRRRPVRVVWSHQFDRIDDAFAFEKQIQGWSRAKRLALADGPVRRPARPGLAAPEGTLRHRGPGGFVAQALHAFAPRPPGAGWRSCCVPTTSGSRP